MHCKKSNHVQIAVFIDVLLRNLSQNIQNCINCTSFTWLSNEYVK